VQNFQRGKWGKCGEGEGRRSGVSTGDPTNVFD